MELDRATAAGGTITAQLTEGLRIALAVTAMIFGSLPPSIARMRRIASWPSITGMRTSMMTMFGGRSAMSRASSADPA